MSSESNSQQGAQPQTRQLNLQTMASQFMTGVQQHLDLLAFNLAGHASVTEGAYRARADLPQVRRLVGPLGNFEQLQAFARDVLTRQVVGDAVNLAVGCLHNCHLFLSLVKATGGAESASLAPETQRAAQQAQQDFLRAPLDQKFNLLEELYGVLCPLEDTILGLAVAAQANVQTGGVLRPPFPSESDELILELQAARIETDEIHKPWFDAVETHTKVFRPGNRVAFTDRELQLVLYTVAVFAHQLFTSVTRYARSLKEPS